MIDIVISGQKCLVGLTSKEHKQIAEDLTFDNPKYSQIMKYSKWGSTREPKYLEYFRYFQNACHSENGEPRFNMIVPIGYKIPDNIEIGQITDKRCNCLVNDFPKFAMTLRNTQREALDSFFEHNKSLTDISGSIQLPTGKGKTILGLAIAERLSCRTLIVVHKVDLVKGWIKNIKEAFNDKADVGIIRADSRKCGKHFTIATIQTLNRMSKEELEVLYDYFGLVIQDEMHHCPSTSFSLADNFRARYRLGLTATPERNDGLSHVMNLYYGDFCYKYGHKEDDEDILSVRVIKRSVPVYYDPVAKFLKGKYTIPDFESVNNFDEHYALKDNCERVSRVTYSKRPRVPYANIDRAVVEHEKTVDFICKDIISEYEKGHSCIAFFSGVSSVDIYFQKLQSMGVPADSIGLYYGSNNKECEQVIDKAENNRKFITLATYSKATEGTDVKQWEVGFLVSSINTGKNVEQAVGRIRRVKGDKKLQTALLYDYRYNQCYQIARHGATRDERYGLLKFEFEKPVRSMFSKGFKNRV